METNNTINRESNACKMRGSGYCPKPLETANSFLSKKWTISLIITIGNFNKLRFNQILEKVDGITAKTLTDRLKELKKLGLVKRMMHHEIPPRVDYELTAKGKKLMKVIVPLIKWARNN